MTEQDIFYVVVFFVGFFSNSRLSVLCAKTCYILKRRKRVLYG